MPSQETIYQAADRVATITLNRPDKLNAQTAIME
jgi:enoyl-CoA hydratase/carnithine racemase